MELEKYGVMNVIYKYINLTRLERGEPPYYYVGSKVECSLHKPYDDKDIYYLYDNKDDRCYFGSPSRQSYWDHWKTDTFTVEILEKVPDRRMCRLREEDHLCKVDAAGNIEYYNMTNVTFATKGGCRDKEAIVNIYGENYAQFAQRMSNRSKRDGRANELGFSNFAELAIFIKSKVDEGFNHAQISRELLKVDNRKFSSVTTKYWDLDKMMVEIEKFKGDSEAINTIRNHISLGASINKISEIMNLEIPTIRYLIGEYWFGESNSRRTAKLFNKTQLEMELEITKKWLNGRGVKDILTDYDGISDTTIKRYLEDCIRRNLDGIELK